MIIFRSWDKNNIGRALVYHVWQTRDMPDLEKLSAGDPAYIKANNTNQEVFYLGVVDRIVKEPLHSWPGKWTPRDPNAVPTIYFRPISENDFFQSQGGFNYKEE